MCVVVGGFGFRGWGVTKISQAFQNNFTKIHDIRNHMCGGNFKLKLWTCAWLSAHVHNLNLKFVYNYDFCKTFRENILETSWNVSDTTPRLEDFRRQECMATFTVYFTTECTIYPHYYAMVFTVLCFGYNEAHWVHRRFAIYIAQLSQNNPGDMGNGNSVEIHCTMNGVLCLEKCRATSRI